MTATVWPGSDGRAGGVFTDDLIEAWINWKKEKELDEMHLRPHPFEFHLYYDS